MNRETAKETAKAYLADYLQGKGIDIGRPFHCLNPEHTDENPSMSFDRKRNICHCFSCGATYDIFHCIGLLDGIEGFKGQLEKACDLYGIIIDEGSASPKQAHREPQPEDMTEYYKQCSLLLDSDSEYLQKRGISLATAGKYVIGLDPAFKAGKDTIKALIIPTGKYSFVARNTADGKPRYWKHGTAEIFPRKADQQKPLIVCEGEIDCLSIIEAGGNAVSMGTVQNKNKLYEYLEDFKKPVILALDNDKAGQAAETELYSELMKKGIETYKYNLSGAYKDPNERLLNDTEGFKDDIKRLMENPREVIKEVEKAEYEKETALYHVKDFINGIADSVNTEAIPTRFSQLDTALDGGMFPGLYFIGGMSSVGKTTLTLQIADQIAMQGRDILVFSLEMARSELMAKSISRLTYKISEKKGDKKQAKTTRGITTGKRYETYREEDKKTIAEAIHAYKDYAGHVYIHEGIGNIGFNEIRKATERHIDITGNKPVIVVDYVQLLAPYDVRASDKQNIDKAVMELKRLSRDYGLVVIGISSFNRAAYQAGNYGKGKVSMADFKESGALEYSADVLIGLEFTAAGTKEYNEQEEKQKEPREISLVIMKNRNGRAWQYIEFLYYPMFNLFREI